jgi:hypothetical protein
MKSILRWTPKLAPKPSLPNTVIVLCLLAAANIAFASDPQSGRSWLNGFVFADSDTRGLPDAKVELIGDQDNERLRSVRLETKTNADGKYSLRDVPYGEYTFQVSAEGYKSYRINLYVASDALTQIHVKMKKE